jgi:alpha-beta hydrolase superfamily lysophospholipase
MVVDVPGGRLAVHQLAGNAGCPRTVVAAHGITANGLSLAALARALPDGIRLLAPDLRGRAESREITGPWGIGCTPTT